MVRCAGHGGGQPTYPPPVQLIGGCCRTKPSDIQTIAKWARV
ncbi:homocysteine S-methyltransferase family protein [Domibacillus tundrae]